MKNYLKFQSSLSLFSKRIYKLSSNRDRNFMDFSKGFDVGKKEPKIEKKEGLVDSKEQKRVIKVIKERLKSLSKQLDIPKKPKKKPAESTPEEKKTQKEIDDLFIGKEKSTTNPKKIEKLAYEELGKLDDLLRGYLDKNLISYDAYDSAMTYLEDQMPTVVNQKGISAYYGIVKGVSDAFSDERSVKAYDLLQTVKQTVQANLKSF